MHGVISLPDATLYDKPHYNSDLATSYNWQNCPDITHLIITPIWI